MRTFLFVVLGNFTVTCFVLGLVAAGIAIARHPKPVPRAFVYEALLRWFLFFSIGVSFFFNFVMHVFAHAMIAKLIGWDDSPYRARLPDRHHAQHGARQRGNDPLHRLPDSRDRIRPAVARVSQRCYEPYFCASGLSVPAFLRSR